MFIRFDLIHERDRRTDRHCMTAKTALASHRAVKIAIFTYRSPHFCFPWGRPWGNHAKCCMDGKWMRCLQILSLHVPIQLLPFLRYSEIFVKKSSFYHTPLHSTPPLGGFPSEYRHPLWCGKTRMVSLPDGEKFWRYIYSFWRDPQTWQTDRRADRRTDRHCMTAKIALASHRAVKTGNAYKSIPAGLV